MKEETKKIVKTKQKARTDLPPISFNFLHA